MAGPASLSLANGAAIATAAEGITLALFDPQDVAPRLLEALAIRNGHGRLDAFQLFAFFRAEADVAASLTVVASSDAPPLVVIRERSAGFELAQASRDDGRQRFALRLPAGSAERVYLLAHRAGIDVVGIMVLLGESAGTPVEAEPPTEAEPPRGAEPSAEAPPPPSPGPRPPFSFDEPFLESTDGTDGRGAGDEHETAAEPEARPETGPEAGPQAGPGAERRPLEFAQIGASMPSAAQLGASVPVIVRLARGRVQVTAGTSHDEQVIVVHPELPVTVTLVRRGLDLDTEAVPAETGSRTLTIPEPGSPEATVTFRLRAVELGDAEVQVLVRQDHPQPIAVLRLRCHVQESPIRNDDGAPMAEASSELARAIDPFLAPKTLTVDEDLVGAEARLSYELVLPGVHDRYDPVVLDKAELMATLFTEIEAAWALFAHLDTAERSAAFRGMLREVGDRLARRVLPAELYDRLAAQPEEFDELTILTSAETDIPWELLYIWDDDRGIDEFDDGFLGRAGLVRWIYSTAHPKDLRIRAGAAHYLIPEYTDARIALTAASFESEYLDAFQASPITPGSVESISRLLRGGTVDLLHFAGHGMSDDSADPPVQQMVLAGYRLPAADGGADAGADAASPDAAEPPDPRTVAYSLADLRADLPDEPPLALPAPGPLVVLNACRIGRPPTKRSEQGGFAEAFLRGGAAAFVGCLWSVGDEPARAFIAAFYSALGQGLSVSAATIQARLAARASGDSSWLAYTVYAHPDARVQFEGIDPPPSAHRTLAAPSVIGTTKGAAMTTTAPSTSRGSSQLSAAQLRALHPHVVNIPDGRLGTGASVLPTTDKDFRTVAADLDALFSTHLPQFIAAQNSTKPVPLLIWAHGGLVDKGAGLRVAQAQVEWWKSNGAYPVHFVWETGLASSLWDAVKDALPGRPRSMDDFFDGVIEQAVRFARGEATWGAMKTVAENASKAETGGAWQFARRLGRFMSENPGAIEVHAVGHSAGSIFHSHLVPVALAAGVPRIRSLSLLAPAVRVDTFKRKLVPVLDRVDALAMFTMAKTFEKDDTCLGIYKKSLLYLIRAALEKEAGAEILGLQECVKADAELSALFGVPGSGAKAEVVWSKSVGGGPSTSTQSTTHGGFDGDPETMNSVARRVVGPNLRRPWVRTRAVEDLWPTANEVFDYVASRSTAPAPSAAASAAEGRRRALCIGIDTYPNDPLNGCVGDAMAWAGAFTAAGFGVETLLNENATRANMVDRIQNLVRSSRAGDVLALQYSGHGTTVVDMDGDEAEEDHGGALADEALCPVDFRDGELLIDDDLGALWDLLPDGVSLTIFFDSCHSGGGQRTVLPKAIARNARSRYVHLGRSTVDAYVAKRGGMPVVTARDNERSVFFGACLATEVAYESPHETPNGPVTGGDFTARAIPLLHAAIGASTNAEFHGAVLAAFGEGRAQTPVLKPPALQGRMLLVGALAQPTVAVPVPPADGGRPADVPEPIVPAGGTDARNHAIAEFLRATAALIES